jgi:hypothetical protein
MVPYKHSALSFNICPASNIVSIDMKIITFVRKIRYKFLNQVDDQWSVREKYKSKSSLTS